MKHRRHRLQITAVGAVMLAATACGSSRTADEFAAIYAGSTETVQGTVSGTGSTNPRAPRAGTTGNAGSGNNGTTGDVTAPAMSQTSAPGSGDQGGQTTTPKPEPEAPQGPDEPTEAGRDGSGEGGDAGGGGGQAAPPNSGAPIKLASVSTLSGPVGAAIGGGVKGAQAWAAMVNANGGIEGHPVELFVAEDGGDPARHRSLVEEMVESRGVVAFLHNAAALSGQAAVPYLEENSIPAVGSEGGSAWVNTSPMYFPQMPSDTAQAASNGAAIAAAADGMTKIAIITCSEIAGCASATNLEGFEQAGLEVVYNTKASLAQPDYTSQCLNARDAGAEILHMGMDGQSVKRIADSCASVGYNPQYTLVPQAVVLEHQGIENLQGMTSPQLTALWFQTDKPAVAEFVGAMQQYAPGTEITASAIQGWVSAKVMETAIRNAVADGADPSTSAGLLDGLYAIQGDDIGGLTVPLTYDEGPHGDAIQPCWWAARIVDGAYAPLNGGDRTCS